MKYPFLYFFAGILIILGLLCLRTVFKKRDESKKLIEQEIPLTGKASKVHLVYLEIVLIIMGIYVLLR